MKRLAVLLLALSFFVFHNTNVSAQNYYGLYVIGDENITPYALNVGFYKGNYKKDLKKGDHQACDDAFKVAMSYLDGRKGDIGNEKSMKANEAQAIEWFQKALSSCSVDDFSGPTHDASKYAGYVGYRFLGQGTPAVKPNAQLAELWLLRGAKENRYKDSNAAYNLAVAYLKGDVLPQNSGQAMHWLEVAVTGQNARATRLLAELLRDGKVVPQDLQRSMALLGTVPELEAREGRKHSNEVAAREQGQQEAAQRAAANHTSFADILNAVSTGVETGLAANPPVQYPTPQQYPSPPQVQYPVPQSPQYPAPRSEPTTHSTPSRPTPASLPSPAQTATTTAPAISSPGTNTNASVTQRNPVNSNSNSAGCIDVTHSVSVTSEWKTNFGSCDKEVVGRMTNNSGEWATCTTAYHKNGQWTEYEIGSIGPGQTHGGEMSGFYTCGADSSTVRYACFAGKDPVNANGHVCSVIKF